MTQDYSTDIDIALEVYTHNKKMLDNCLKTAAGDSKGHQWLAKQARQWAVWKTKEMVKVTRLQFGASADGRLWLHCEGYDKSTTSYSVGQEGPEDENFMDEEEDDIRVPVHVPPAAIESIDRYGVLKDLVRWLRERPRSLEGLLQHPKAKELMTVVGDEGTHVLWLSLIEEYRKKYAQLNRSLRQDELALHEKALLAWFETLDAK